MKGKPKPVMKALLLKRRHVEQMTSMSRSAIYARLADKTSTFPRPVKLDGSAAVRWVREEVERYIESLKARR